MTETPMALATAPALATAAAAPVRAPMERGEYPAAVMDRGGRHTAGAPIGRPDGAAGGAVPRRGDAGVIPGVTGVSGGGA